MILQYLASVRSVKMECITNSSNNTSNLEKYYESMFYKHLINGWFTLFIIISGILANLITIFVLLNKKMRKTSTNMYLLALSISNIISLSLLFFMTGLRFTLVNPYQTVFCFHAYENFINLSMPYLTPINNLFQLSGIYLTTAVSLDWYFLIKAKSVRKDVKSRILKKKTRFIIIGIFVFSFFYTLPNWFLYESRIDTIDTITHVNNELDMLKLTTRKTITYVHATKTEFGDNTITKSLIQIYMYIPFVFAIPILILLTVNFLIIKIIVTVNERKKQLGNSSKIDRSITVMLILIVILFMFGQIPTMVSNIISSITPDINLTDSYIVFKTFANFILCVNLSCNFGIYCLFNEKFRGITKFMFYQKFFCRNEFLKQATNLSNKYKTQSRQGTFEPNYELATPIFNKRHLEIVNPNTNIQLITTA